MLRNTSNKILIRADARRKAREANVRELLTNRSQIQPKKREEAIQATNSGDFQASDDERNPTDDQSAIEATLDHHRNLRQRYRRNLDVPASASPLLENHFSPSASILRRSGDHRAVIADTDSSEEDDIQSNQGRPKYGSDNTQDEEQEENEHHGGDEQRDEHERYEEYEHEEEYEHGEEDEYGEEYEQGEEYEHNDEVDHDDHEDDGEGGGEVEHENERNDDEQNDDDEGHNDVRSNTSQQSISSSDEAPVAPAASAARGPGRPTRKAKKKPRVATVKTKRANSTASSKTVGRPRNVAPSSHKGTEASDNSDSEYSEQGWSGLHSDSTPPPPAVNQQAEIAPKSQTRKAKKRISRKVQPKAHRSEDNPEDDNDHERRTTSRPLRRTRNTIPPTGNGTGLPVDSENEESDHRPQRQGRVSQPSGPADSTRSRSTKYKSKVQMRKAKKQSSHEKRSKRSHLEAREGYDDDDGGQCYELDRIIAVQTCPKARDPDRRIWYKVQFDQRYSSKHGSKQPYWLTAEAMPGSKCRQAAAIAEQTAKDEGAESFGVRNKVYKVNVILDDLPSDSERDNNREGEEMDAKSREGVRQGDSDQEGPGQENEDCEGAEKETSDLDKRTSRTKKRQRNEESRASNGQTSSHGKRKSTRPENRAVKRRRNN